MPFFSVIIPIYNLQEYADECIASVIGQTLEDIEVVLVDDGSTDGSPAICDRYAACDSRVRVVHKENGGASSARNAGIRVSTGEYVLFVDGDDYYDDMTFLDALRCHLRQLGCPDVAVFGAKSYFAQREVLEHDGLFLDEQLNSLDVVPVLARLIATDSLPISPWSHAVRAAFLAAHELMFQIGLLCEDIEWSLRAFDKASRVTVLCLKPYVYRRGRPESITSNIGPRNVQDGIAILEKYANAFEYSSEEMRRVLLGYVAYQFCVFCGLSDCLRGEDRDDCLKRLRPLAWLLQHDASPKVKNVRRVYRILGLPLTVRILGSYLRFRRS